MILGIDPGSVSAAYGLLDEEGIYCATGDIPVVDRMVDAAGLNRLLGWWGMTLIAVVEQVSAMPKQGVTSSFRFGMGCGLIRGVLVARGVPIIQVAPTKWKKHFNLDNDGEKSRALALRLWPTCRDLVRKKDHGRAEALLMARWYLETHK
jgi:Holliday junction resolvasome RuvABC endonuclease subunit